MADEPEREVPNGAAVFPLIPAELGVHPLTLAVIHALVFLAGSEKEIVNSAAADEAVESMAGYLRRLTGRRLHELCEDMDCLIRYARQEKWPKQLVRSLQSLLAECGISEEGSADVD
jgi:hypothetical protein